LGVWENNVRATKFYEKFGFERVGEHEFWLGNECQLDYIFGREV
jgi:ribosomal protein S18 acetylase RimI-like enzyme